MSFAEFQMQLLSENAELRAELQRIKEQKTKYKQRTKKLLEALEEERGGISQNADCIEEMAEELQNATWEKQSMVEEYEDRIEALQAQVTKLRLQLDESQQSTSTMQRTALKSRNPMAGADETRIVQLEVLNSQLMTTLSAFLQIFNYTVDQLDFKRGELPGFLQRVHAQLMVQSKDSFIVPVFIDKAQCEMQLLLSTTAQLQNPLLRPVGKKEIEGLLDDERKQARMLAGYGNLLDNNYQLKQLTTELDPAGLVPYKAFSVMQQFQTTNPGAVKPGAAAQLLVSLSACYQEYQQQIHAHKANLLVKKQKKEIMELQRKLQLQVPYDVHRLQETVDRLRKDVQKYYNLYLESLGTKKLTKRIKVQLGGPSVEGLQAELQQFKQLIQQINIATPGQTRGDFQEGCVSTARAFLELIEETLQKLYDIKPEGQVLQMLSDLQKECRDALMRILEDKTDDEM